MTADEKKKIQIYSTASTSAAREVTPFWREKYERDARKYWDIFYKRHQDKFFKDRHYLDKEWGRYFDAPEGQKKTVLEVGCGVGNTIFPLVTTYKNMLVYACDFSPRAIGLVKAHKDYTEDRVHAFICDLTSDDLTQNILPFSVDIVTMVFVLSAVSPERMCLVLQNIRKVLRPNGHVLLRDYADGDLAQERLNSKDQKISENFYVRGDGTRAFYFSVDFLIGLFQENGFHAEDVDVCCKQVENRSLELVMNRRWIQAVFALNSSHDNSNNHLKDSRDHVEIDMSQNMIELFGVSPSIDEVVQCTFLGFFNDEHGSFEFLKCRKLYKLEVLEIKLRDSSFKIKVLGKENQHTCKSTGLMLWESARFMSRLLDENPSIVAGKTVLELGCGSAGICSMIATHFAELVVSTDGDTEALNLLKVNVTSNLEPDLCQKMIIHKLEWGSREDINVIKHLLGEKGGFEMILGTDVTYNPDAVTPLFETARDLILNDPTAKAKPALVLCHIQRRVDEESIISTASKFGFKLVDRLVRGKRSEGGIIGSWFSEGSSQEHLLQNTPLNIMYFQA